MLLYVCMCKPKMMKCFFLHDKCTLSSCSAMLLYQKIIPTLPFPFRFVNEPFPIFLSDLTSCNFVSEPFPICLTDLTYCIFVESEFTKIWSESRFKRRSTRGRESLKTWSLAGTRNLWQSSRRDQPDIRLDPLGLYSS